MATMEEAEKATLDAIVARRDAAVAVGATMDQTIPKLIYLGRELE